VCLDKKHIIMNAPAGFDSKHAYQLFHFGTSVTNDYRMLHLSFVLTNLRMRRLGMRTVYYTPETPRYRFETT
jgi:hypothetical protein